MKLQLDTYEQQWVAKLACYIFNNKYIPSSKNIIADALSHCSPRWREVASMLLWWPPHWSPTYLFWLCPGSLQTIKHYANDCGSKRGDLPYVYEHATKQSFSRGDASAILKTQSLWESCARMCAVDALQELSQLIPLMMITYLCSQKESYMKGSWVIMSFQGFYIMWNMANVHPGERNLCLLWSSLYFIHWEKLTTSNVTPTGHPGTKSPRQGDTSLWFLTFSSQWSWKASTTVLFIKGCLRAWVLPVRGQLIDKDSKSVFHVFK